MIKPLALSGLLLLCAAATSPAALAHSPVLLADATPDMRAQQATVLPPKAETDLADEVEAAAPGAEIAPEEELVVRGRYTSEPAR